MKLRVSRAVWSLPLLGLVYLTIRWPAFAILYVVAANLLGSFEPRPRLPYE